MSKLGMLSCRLIDTLCTRAPPSRTRNYIPSLPSGAFRRRSICGGRLSEEPLHLLAKLRQSASKPRRRRDSDGGAEAREVVVEPDVPGLPRDRLGGEHEAEAQP